MKKSNFDLMKFDLLIISCLILVDIIIKTWRNAFLWMFARRSNKNKQVKNFHLSTLHTQQKKFLPKPILFISLYKLPLSTFKIDPSGHPSRFSFLFFSIKKSSKKGNKKKATKRQFNSVSFQPKSVITIRKYVINWSA